MSKLKKIFISCFCTLMIMLIVPFSISADEQQYLTIEVEGTETPPVNRAATPNIFPNYLIENSCSYFYQLTDAQRQYIWNVADNRPQSHSGTSLIFQDVDGNVLLGDGAWIWSNGSKYQIHFNGGVSNFGLYYLYEDGTYSSKLDLDNIDIVALYYYYEFYGIGNAVPNYSVRLNGCTLENTYTLTVLSNNNLYGSASGTGSYVKDSDVTVYASPNTDYRFVSWSDGSTANPYTFKLTQDTTITAIFESSVYPPGLNLPNTTLPTQTINTQQNTYLNENSSNAVKGGSINLFQIDYYNIYTVVQTSESDQFFDSRNDNYYVYQESNDGVGHYIFAVYDYSKLYVFAPNMSVSSSGFTLTYSQAHNIKYSYASSNGLIQRDVNRFEFEYIDDFKQEYFGYDKLPFSNSSNNQNYLEWIGTRTQMLNGQASSMSAAFRLNTGTIMTDLYFVITDTTNSYENAQMMNNQTVINNNMVQNFENVNNSIVSGTSNSQQVESSNNQSNQLLDNTISSYDQLEQGFKDDLDDHLGDLEIDFKFGSITDFTRTANFVRTQFDNITSDNPFGLLIGFSLAVGISLLIIGKRL